MAWAIVDTYLTKSFNFSNKMWNRVAIMYELSCLFGIIIVTKVILKITPSKKHSFNTVEFDGGLPLMWSCMNGF